jgi:hypothetical protein
MKTQAVSRNAAHDVCVVCGALHNIGSDTAVESIDGAVTCVTHVME